MIIVSFCYIKNDYLLLHKKWLFRKNGIYKFLWEQYSHKKYSFDTSEFRQTNNKYCIAIFLAYFRKTISFEIYRTGQQRELQLDLIQQTGQRLQSSLYFSIRWAYFCLLMCTVKQRLTLSTVLLLIIHICHSSKIFYIIFLGLKLTTG